MIAVTGITNDVETEITMLRAAIVMVSADRESRMNTTADRKGGYETAEMTLATFSVPGVISPSYRCVGSWSTISDTIHDAVHLLPHGFGTPAVVHHHPTVRQSEHPLADGPELLICLEYLQILTTFQYA